MRSTTGFECYGKFDLGRDANSANALFDSLKGSPADREDWVLQLELMEVRNGLPTDIRILNCSLPELTENCRTITKEIFKILNLKEI